MKLSCEVSLVRFNDLAPPRYSKANIALAKNDNKFYLTVATSKLREKFLIDHQCSTRRSGISLRNVKLEVYIRKADPILLKNFLDQIQVITNPNSRVTDITNIQEKKHIERYKPKQETKTYKALNGELNTDLLNNKCLEKIDICNFTATKMLHVEHSLFKLRNLTDLRLVNCHISRIPKALTKTGLNLKFLSLANNKLDKITSEFILSLKKIIHLDLSNNDLARLPVTFGALNQLEVLHLENNSFQKLPHSFSQLSSLKELYLSKNTLQYFSHFFFKTLKRRKLSKFDLSDVSFVPSFNYPKEFRKELRVISLKNLSGATSLKMSLMSLALIIEEIPATIQDMLHHDYVVCENCNQLTHYEDSFAQIDQFFDFFSITDCFVGFISTTGRQDISVVKYWCNKCR